MSEINDLRYGVCYYEDSSYAPPTWAQAVGATSAHDPGSYDPSTIGGYAYLAAVYDNRDSEGDPSKERVLLKRAWLEFDDVGQATSATLAIEYAGPSSLTGMQDGTVAVVALDDATDPATDAIYGQFGSTVFGTFDIAAGTNTASVTLNAAGIAHIAETGLTRFGLRYQEWDVDGTRPLGLYVWDEAEQLWVERGWPNVAYVPSARILGGTLTTSYTPPPPPAPKAILLAIEA